MKEPLARIHVSPTQQRAAELFAFFADAIQFLGRTAWPVVDLIVRFWIAMPAIVSGLLMANDWNTALMLAINEYQEFLSHFPSSQSRLPQLGEARSALKRLMQ